MKPQELYLQKLHHKRLPGSPIFKPLKKGKLPKPFAKMGGLRISATDLIDVSPTHRVLFLWKDGQILTDRSFFAWLFEKVGDNSLYPLVEMHWHPSHKGLHVKTPCNSELDYTDRQLPGAIELGVRSGSLYDPQRDADRIQLIEKFCSIAGIQLGPEDSLWC